MEEVNGIKIKKTTYDKSGNGYTVGIDEHNYKQLLEISKLVEKKNAKALNLYMNEMLYYFSEEKLTN